MYKTKSPWKLQSSESWWLLLKTIAFERFRHSTRLRCFYYCLFTLFYKFRLLKVVSCLSRSALDLWLWSEAVVACLEWKWKEFCILFLERCDDQISISDRDFVRFWLRKVSFVDSVVFFFCLEIGLHSRFLRDLMMKTRFRIETLWDFVGKKWTFVDLVVLHSNFWDCDDENSILDGEFVEKSWIFSFLLAFYGKCWNLLSWVFFSFLSQRKVSLSRMKLDFLRFCLERAEFCRLSSSFLWFIARIGSFYLEWVALSFLSIRFLSVPYFYLGVQC